MAEETREEQALRIAKRLDEIVTESLTDLIKRMDAMRFPTPVKVVALQTLVNKAMRAAVDIAHPRQEGRRHAAAIRRSVDRDHCSAPAAVRDRLEERPFRPLATSPRTGQCRKVRGDQWCSLGLTGGRKSFRSVPKHSVRRSVCASPATIWMMLTDMTARGAGRPTGRSSRLRRLSRCGGPLAPAMKRRFKSVCMGAQGLELKSCRGSWACDRSGANLMRHGASMPWCVGITALVASRSSTDATPCAFITGPTTG